MHNDSDVLGLQRFRIWKVLLLNLKESNICIIQSWVEKSKIKVAKCKSILRHGSISLQIVRWRHVFPVDFVPDIPRGILEARNFRFGSN